MNSTGICNLHNDKLYCHSCQNSSSFQIYDSHCYLKLVNNILILSSFTHRYEIKYFKMVSK